MKKEEFLLSEQGPSEGLGECHVNSFLVHLRSKGYAERTLRKKRSVTTCFVRWTAVKQIGVQDLDESHLTAFVHRSDQRTTARVKFELAALQPFLKHLRAEAKVPPPALLVNASPADQLKHRYINYLREERGLAQLSIRVYLPFISDFVDEHLTKVGCDCPDRLEALTIQEFLLARICSRSSEYARLLATALRSFLRFLYLRGETTNDLSVCVPTVRRWQQAKVHGFLSPDEVERVVSATDLSTARGCRDHAILLLLARLGLRAGEIITLELDDILWCSGQIVVRGKGQVQDRLPLLSDVGKALAVYLTQDRGRSCSRRVFLRMLAPRVGLTGPAAVGHIVRIALAKAGLRSPGRSAAHLFRHSLATRMIRNGASIAEISQVLRHRSENSTQIYAKVDFETLREVASPWPVKGGGV